MFGNLFNEDVSSFGTALTTVSVLPSPPGHRLDCRLAGIDNQGATCYLNSLLQTLLLTPEFREKLFTLNEQDLGSLQNKDSPNAKVRVIPLQLQRLFAQLLLSDQQSVSTADLTNSFGWTNQEEFQQHDVQELNRILFSAIEESLVGTSAQNIINELYHGTIVNQIICSKCKKISEREEDFLDLTLAIAGASGLEAAFKKCYCDVEMMAGRNQYRCEKCGTYTDAAKGAKIRNLPPVLTISLLRFSYDFVKQCRYKENGRFTFPLEIDMSPYSEKSSLNTEGNTYELFSVVVHRGSAFGGHYFAYIRDIDNLGDWISPDKAGVVQNVDPRTTGLDVIECQSPVDLIENILGSVSHYSMSVDKLCAEITKVTGVSWNKRFKKTHGPINKFLKSCDSFEYNPDSNWVSLCSSGKQSSQGCTAQQQETSLEPGSNEAGAKPVGEDRKILAANIPPSVGRIQPLTSDLGHNWFCFNDSHVSPIQTKDIERQFSGKESAYMLFYRRKNLHRPAEAEGLTSYGIPPNLIKEVEELNATLENQRHEYEVKLNSIKVKAFWWEHFRYDGILQLKSEVLEEAAYFSIEIDKRKTFGDLKAKIQEAIGVMASWEVGNFSVHRMKPRCAAYHLYDEITNENDVLKDLDITSDSLLFVWNGAVLNDCLVENGEECEPYQFLLKDQEDSMMAVVVLAKNKSLADLYKLATETTGMDVHLLQALRLAENGVRQVEVIPRFVDVTLAASALRDGEVLVLVTRDASVEYRIEDDQLDNTKSGEIDVHLKPEWSITLQNRLSGNGTPHTCKIIELQTRASVTIKDLKIQCLNLLKVDTIPRELTRLREDHRTMGIQPPLREGLSLADAGLSDGVSLVLENGRPPQHTEMTVIVKKIVSGKLLSKQEFLVDRQWTLLDMLQLVCNVLHCDGTQWYLSKTDVYGDPSEPLEDSSATLMDLLINDGDTLILQPGSLVRKDQLCLNLFLVPETPSPIQGDKSATGAGDVAQRQDVEDKVMLELAAKLSVGDDIPNKDLNLLNCSLFPAVKPLFENPLVVTKAMDIEELKQALMSTERFQTLRIPTSNFMRLRVIEGERLRAVVRHSSQVLRHGSSKEPVSLAVQILNSEENLGIHEILLMVTQKIGGTRIYMPAKEMIWNISSGVGAGDLKKVIATRLSLPLHDVLIAKYSPETVAWTVLRDQPQKTPKNKGKKKSSGYKTNVRQSPYYVQDGDLIGVKLLSADKGILDTDDFYTQEDLEKRQQMLHDAEEKKRLREEKKKLLSLDGFLPNRRREVPLTIKVDKFS